MHILIRILMHMHVGMSLHHCQFPGSTSLRPSTFVNMICDIVWSFQQSSNITHFFFINGHGGNALPMQLAFAILRSTAHNVDGNVVPWLAKSEDEDNKKKKNKSNRGSFLQQYWRKRPTKYKYEMISWYANEDSQRLAKSYANNILIHTCLYIHTYIYILLYILG